MKLQYKGYNSVRTEVIITEFIVSHFYQICFFGSHNRSVCVLVIKPTIGYYEYGYFDSVIRISHSMYTCVCFLLEHPSHYGCTRQTTDHR